MWLQHTISRVRRGLTISSIVMVRMLCGPPLGPVSSEAVQVLTNPQPIF